jgi:hypothetical protein
MKDIDLILPVSADIINRISYLSQNRWKVPLLRTWKNYGRHLMICKRKCRIFSVEGKTRTALCDKVYNVYSPVFKSNNTSMDN